MDQVVRRRATFSFLEIPSWNSVGENLGKSSKKKNWDESVRLTDWVDPPFPPYESVRKM